MEKQTENEYCESYITCLQLMTGEKKVDVSSRTNEWWNKIRPLTNIYIWLVHCLKQLKNNKMSVLKV